MRFSGLFAPRARWLAGLIVAGWLPVIAGADVTLAPPPYSVKNVGPQIYSANLYTQCALTDPLSGDRHLILAYTSPGCRYELLDVNLTRGTKRLVDGTNGLPGPSAFVVHPNGKFYMASSDPGHFMSYDLQTGQARVIRSLADKGGQWMIVGDDGAIYLGEHVKGYVERYDPATDTWENLGVMDDPGPPYYRYAYSVGADNRYIYVGVGKTPWYLVVFDRKTRTQKTFWKGLKLTEVIVSKGTSGGWYAHVTGVPGMNWFKLENGVPVTVGAPSVVDYALRGGVCVDKTFALCGLPYEIDVGRAYPISTSTMGTTEIAWRAPGGEWRTLTQAVDTYPQITRQLVQGPGSDLLGFTGSYGPVFNIPAGQTSNLALLGTTQRSTYDALYSASAKRWFLSGYTHALLEYDPSIPWTLLPGRLVTDACSNPYQASPGIGTYQYYLAEGSDGLIYLGIHHERDSTGGDLGWFNPFTKTTGHLRAPFEFFDVRDLKPALGGTKLVYSSVSLAGLDAKLFVFDVARKQVEREIVPLPGASALDKVVEVSPGIVVGVVGSSVYSVDIRDGRVIYKRDLGASFTATAVSDRRLTLGPDGRVWLVLVPMGAGVLPQIARIAPADGTVQMLQGISGLVNFLLVRNPGGTGYDALLYGTTELRRIDGILRIAAAPPGSPQNLRRLR